MSSSTSDEELVKQLRTIISRINFYFGTVIFYFGIIGNILNILILSQRSLRANTCIMILLASSVTGIITIVAGLTPRILSNWDLDESETTQWMCKLHSFVVFTFRSITFSLIMLATFDRWLVSSTNVYFRQLCSHKNILLSISFITFFLMIIHGQIFYCYEPNMRSTSLRCYAKDSTCQLVNDLTFAIITIFLPLMLIAVFGWMTIRNIRLSQGRIQPVTNGSGPSQRNDSHRQKKVKKTDNYLFIMLFIQVILIVFLTLPMSIQKLYVTLTMNAGKSPVRLKILFIKLIIL